MTMAENDNQGPNDSKSNFEETLGEMWAQGMDHPFSWPALIGGLIFGMLLSAPLGPVGLFLGGFFGALVVISIKLDN